MPKALIVDDNQANLYMLEALLGGNGYEVSAVSNGKEALARAKESRFDLIISDILMPVMDGFTLCREWKRDPVLSKIPFIIYTATYTDTKDEQLALNLGADLFIIKPTEPDAFLQLIRDALGRDKLKAASPAAPPPVPETTLLKEYSEALVRKLEAKLVQLETANRALQDSLALQKRMQDEIQRTQRLEALRLFAGGMAHDFNNLLTGLFSSLQLAQTKWSDPPAAGAHLRFALEIFGRARDLSRRLLSFTMGGASRKSAFLLPPLIRECAALSLGGSNISFEFQGQETPPPVQGDANQLSQVFNNIIVNARQAMEKGGRLTVSVVPRRLEPLNVEQLPAGAYVQAVFRDEGTGIPEEILGKIFDPFFTTKKQGTGLGLAVSYAIIKEHGGYLGVRSSPGAGSAFTVLLPVSEQPVPAERADAVPEILKGSGKVLVMDDEDFIRQIARSILEEAGYAIETAAHGDEAIALWAKAAAAGAPFDAAILDLTVKGGMGGEQTAAEMLKINPGALLIVSSGQMDNELLSSPRKYGFAAALTKPYLPLELLRCLNAVLAR